MGVMNSVTALEFQGWFVGSFYVSVPGTYLVQCTGVHNFYIEKQEYEGIRYFICSYRM